MKLMILAALLSAVTAAYIAHPLMKSAPKKAWALILAIALSASALYLWRGAPDMPSHPAMFETSGPRAAQRDLTRQELAVMQTLAEQPDDSAAKIALGEIYYAKGLAALAQQGDPDRARLYFDNALQVAPGDAPYRKDLESDRDKLNNRD